MENLQWKEIHYEELDSTNLQAKRLARQRKDEMGQVQGSGDTESGIVLTADLQTAGRGRLGRSWESPRGAGLWMSLLFRPELPPASASMLTLVAALAVARGIEEVSSVRTQIKWPNDLVADGKKVCGILTEMHANLHQIEYVVIGIGINVNTTEFPEELQQKATSLYLCSEQKTELDILKKEILKSFDQLYKEFCRCGDLSALRTVYEEQLANKGREVRILPADSQKTGGMEKSGDSLCGTCLGINEKGELLVRRADGFVETVVSGEVSVRGIYGYV